MYGTDMDAGHDDQKIGSPRHREADLAFSTLRAGQVRADSREPHQAYETF